MSRITGEQSRRNATPTAHMTDQEDWIKTHLPKSAQTQCRDCGKFMSKFWKDGSGDNNIMTRCGVCDSRRGK